MTTVPGASCQLRLFSAGGFCWTRTPPASQRAARTEGTTTGSRTMGRHGVSSIHAALDDFVTKLKRGQLETNSNRAREARDRGAHPRGRRAASADDAGDHRRRARGEQGDGGREAVGCVRVVRQGDSRALIDRAFAREDARSRPREERCPPRAKTLPSSDRPSSPRPHPRRLLLQSSSSGTCAGASCTSSARKRTTARTTARRATTS